VKAVPIQRGGRPWRAQSPRELRALFRSKQPSGVADFRVEQDPEVGAALGASPYARPVFWELRFLEAGRVVEFSGANQRQEGIGAGDGARLRGRRKALKGKTPRADLA
jgi:hypothetical protein